MTYTNPMILEVAMLNIKLNLESEFEATFRQASKIISSMNGFIDVELQKCLEQQGKYLLLVKWQTLEDHTVGFRGSSEYQEWRALLHHFYDPFPIVEHFENIELNPI
jgi:heme-degrading monooxygenase HmoA